MFRWGFAILEAIHSLGSEASLSEVYSVLEQHFPLTGQDQKETIYSRRPAYQHQVRNHISNLCQHGSLVRQRRGHYSLSHQGTQRFLNELAEYDPESPLVAKERDRKSWIIEVEVESLEEGGYLAACPAIQGLSRRRQHSG